MLPVPLERTVTFGKGTAHGPASILAASQQLELHDEQRNIDVDASHRVRTLAPVSPPDADGELQPWLGRLESSVRALSDRFVLGLGGEHTLTYSLARGLATRHSGLTVVQVDAHADLADRVNGEQWSHGTVMRRLLESGASLVQIGIRSLSRDERQLIDKCSSIRTFFAHRLDAELDHALLTLHEIAGPVYLTIDVDGIDPAVIPSTGTPQPGGLSWRQLGAVIDATFRAPRALIIGADIVEYVPSRAFPACDIIPAKIGLNVLAARRAAQRGSAL